MNLYKALTFKPKTAQEKPIGKYGNLKNFIRERSGADIDEATIDKKLRTFFEDLITEILKNPSQWDRTRNINFMELFNYIEEPLTPEKPMTTVTTPENLTKDFKEMTKKPEVIRSDMGKIAPNEQ